MGNEKRPAKPTREERLAAQLRANLRLRKQQARAIGQEQSDDSPAAPDDNPALVKPPRGG